MKKARIKKTSKRAQKPRLFIILTFFAIFALILFAGCKKETKKETPAFGLKTVFVENAPPSNVTVGEKFAIYVDAQNVGAYTIPPQKASFYLLGLGTNVKGYTAKLKNSNTLASGASERLMFGNNVYSDLPLQSPFLLNMLLESCYSYATNTQVKLCIAKQSSAICSLTGEKIEDNSNSIGPIRISSLTERVEGNTLIVEFIIGNAGEGRVYMPSANCDGIVEGRTSEMLKENIVKITINDGGIGLSCGLLNEGLSSIEGLSGYARLGAVTCKKKLGDEVALGILQISTEYIYREKTEKSLTISPA
ncbi:MAG: hypothetical protein QXS07_00245 [Candidatus Pacearchaeota archaeon]